MRMIKYKMTKSLSDFKSAVMILLLFTFITKVLFSQYPVNYQYTLLPSKVIDEIIGASSGDMAMLHINGMAAYMRPRTNAEYSDTLNECIYVINKLKEYGIKNYKIERLGKTSTWRGFGGSIWEISPGSSKIADFGDLPAMLAEGSENADVQAVLVWAGEGLTSFFENNVNSVKGKIVVTSGNLWNVHERAMKSGALGTISFYSSRSLIDPVQIPIEQINGGGFAFLIPPREGQLLRDRLLRSEEIIVKVKVRTGNEELDLQVPQCVILGTDTTAGEVLFTAHLFEGYVKMGANDNISGSAVLIEVAHALNDLITKGKIAKPVRNIRFLWIPEFSGTIPWVNKHQELVSKALCDINLDMVGLRLRDSRSFMYLHRSGYSNTNYVNDVMESYYRFVGETNSSGITDDLERRGFSRRIISPTGTDDPFYYKISSMHGSSDNAVFNDWAIGVPGVKMITWPDDYYHSSGDTPDKCDPTQLRRVVFIAAAGAYTIASAGESLSIRILAEMYAGSNTRMGIQIAKASDMILSSTAETLKSRYKRAVYNLEGFVNAENASMAKVIQLSHTPEVISLINDREKKLENLLQIQLTGMRDLMLNRAKDLKISPAQIVSDKYENSASKIIPVPTEKTKTMGYNGDIKIITALSPEFLNENPYLRLVNPNETAGLADGKRNILQIKKVIDVEFERESPLEEIINYFNVLKEAGLMKF